jgi:hypothetical protein
VSDQKSIPKPEQLPACAVEGSLECEWQTFQRELGRLLSEGKAGRFALVKADELVGIWDTEDEALREGYRRFGLEPFLVQPVTEDEPIFRSGTTWRSPRQLQGVRT